MTAAKREEELCNEIQDVIDKYDDLTPTERIGCLETVKGVQIFRICKTAEELEKQG